MSGVGRRGALACAECQRQQRKSEREARRARGCQWIRVSRHIVLRRPILQLLTSLRIRNSASRGARTWEINYHCPLDCTKLASIGDHHARRVFAGLLSAGWDRPDLADEL